METFEMETQKQWFAMRDLKRANALQPAYKQLSEAGMEVFTPMATSISVRNGKRTRREVPVIHDLLFVYDCRKNLDPIVAKTPTLQYRFKKGGKQGEPIVIAGDEMSKFIGAVKATDAPKFYSADELTTLMCGRNIRMVGGILNGYEGMLQTVRGSKTKRLIVTLSSLMAVSVKIDDEFVEVL